MAPSILSPEARLTTLGIIILMTIIAFEAMAVATALPTAARSLHGLAAYGWSFTGFLVASVVGMVASGMRSDRNGPRSPLLVGLGLFVVGLLVASAAGAMWVLVAARVVQGLSTGLLITAMYVVIGEVYDDLVRPRMFAALASAWVVPGLVGPIVAGWVTQHLSWRWVFGGLAPFVVLGGLMMVPSLRQLRAHPARTQVADSARLGYAVLAAAGIAGVANLGQSQTPLSWALGVAGAVAMVLGLRRLLPRGTFTLSRGVPAAVGYRGVLAGTFFGMEAVVPLTLTVQHHYSATMSGLPLMFTAVTWAVGSQIQGRLDSRWRPALLRAGLLLFAVAGAGMTLVALRIAPGWGAFLAWPTAGLGAGFGLTSASVALLDFTTDAQRGSDSSSLQLADSSASALCTAFGGALVAAAAHGRISYGHGLGAIFVVMSVLGLSAIGRTTALRPPNRTAMLPGSSDDRRDAAVTGIAVEVGPPVSAP
ncbi:MFS transporter [Jatrophihabitans telluris]|uniref:MFS transporter n=1 Tax=Jatrophihabitans telluris TaxID=2038343 RepID=A0ABY4R3T0_9ACTN|nr:MFS transporter [Jatrophihabitans telluris]UQX89922.1 MFS transporter [Jatrophihabitans telluris]